MKLTDQTPMPFGKYKGAPMEQVSAGYLLYLWEEGLWNRGDAQSSEGRLAVHDYIKESFHALETQCPDIVVTHKP